MADDPAAHKDFFATTHWSMINAANAGETSLARKAMGNLCEMYWYPLYAYVRRRGYSPHDAQDLTQAFFTRLLEKDMLSGLDQAKGRFRAFLLASMKNFLSNHWQKTSAAKRGGGQQTLSLDHEDAEALYLAEPSASASPEELYERRWALTMLDEVMSRLRQEMELEGKTQLFEVFKDRLAGAGDIPYLQIGESLGISEGAARAAAHQPSSNCKM